MTEESGMIFAGGVIVGLFIFSILLFAPSYWYLIPTGIIATLLIASEKPLGILISGFIFAGVAIASYLYWDWVNMVAFLGIFVGSLLVWKGIKEYYYY